ncbi:MAG: mannonate dehydratase [Bryobacteraceae bacterium]|nr:mannonate dehydratase [Bryobacteraceae bacterium]MDW8377501.1 mannonate dehydratase [Bryobacterales bacterium]
MNTRRQFLVSSSASAHFWPAAAQRASQRPVLDEQDPTNIKLSHRMPIRNLSDDDLLFLRQLGIQWCRIEFGNEAPYEYMKSTQQRLAKFGMKIFSAVHYAYRNVDLQLGRGNRDQVIETYCRFLRDCGRLGIPVANYDWHPANTYTTAEVVTPRGYTARQFSLRDFRQKIEKQAFEREYSAEDIWASYTYFMKAVLPVAEKADVRLALHPDDPPVAKMNGVAKIFVHADGYHRAEQIAGSSRHWGLTFCVGTWSEGGKQMGKDVFEMIQDFGGRGKIVDVHFRNVSTPLPEFHETFPDDGYLDMYQVMKALRQVKFSGTIVADHVPRLAGDDGMRRAGTAYCLAYMRALLRRANEEVG